MNIHRRRDLFYRKPQTSLYRLFALMVMILGGVWLLRQINSGDIQPLFQPTPTPTRAVESYALEGDAQFIAGDLNSAINAYQQAVRVDPTNAQIWAKLARIQT